MAHIQLKNEFLPGIAGLLHYRSDTGKILNQLAEALLRKPSSLSSGERETIAAAVSYWNNCHYCFHCHGAAAASHLMCGIDYLEDIKNNFEKKPINEKLRALLNIAHKVQQGGKSVLKDDIDAAKAAKATDSEIHDTVLIASAFCMYNRYVDGLGTWAPEEAEAYVETGDRLAVRGYVSSK